MSDYTREAFERDRFATAGPVQPPATPQEPDAPVRRKRQLPCPGCVSKEIGAVSVAWSQDIPFLLKQWDTHQSALRALVAQMRQEMDARDAAEKQAMRDGVTAAAAYEKGRQLGTALVVGQLERLLSGPQP